MVVLAISQFVVFAVLLVTSLTVSYFLQEQVSTGKGSPTYGLDSLGNARRQGGAIPIILGTRVKVEPVLINALTKQEGTRQTFKLLYLIGYGELGSMDADWQQRLFLNDQPAGAFPIAKKNGFASSFFTGAAATYSPGLKVTFRYGTANQTAIPGFDRIGRGRDYGVVLQGPSSTTTQVSVTHEMVAAAEEIHLLLIWPGGIHRIDDAKGVRGDSSGIRVEYKDADDPKAAWKYTALDSTANPDWRGSIEAGKSVAGEFWTSGETTATLRRQLEIAFKAKGRYYVRITGLHPDTNTRRVAPTLASVNEVEKETRTYQGLALMAIEGVATEQLSGGLPRVSLISTGIKLTDPRDGTVAPSENNAVIAYNCHLNSTWGAGYAASDLDGGAGGSWRTAADACDALITVQGSAQEKQHTLNLVLDTRAPMEEHLQEILATFRAVTFDHGGLIRVARDEAGGTPRIFDARKVTTNRRNVLELPDGRPDLKVTGLPGEKRHNQVTVAYRDGKDDIFADETYSYPETTPADPNPLELRMHGVTRTSEAKRHAVFHERLVALCGEVLDLGIGWGDHDLVPFDRITLYDDEDHASGSDWKVLDIRFDPDDGRGRILARKYDANVYSGVSVSPTKAASYVNVVSAPSSKGSSTSPQKTEPAAKSEDAGAAQGKTTKDLVYTITISHIGVSG